MQSSYEASGARQKAYVTIADGTYSSEYGNGDFPKCLDMKQDVAELPEEATNVMEKALKQFKARHDDAATKLKESKLSFVSFT